MLGSFRENRSCLERTSGKAKDEEEDVFLGCRRKWVFGKRRGNGSRWRAVLKLCCSERSTSSERCWKGSKNKEQRVKLVEKEQ